MTVTLNDPKEGDFERKRNSVGSNKQSHAKHAQLLSSLDPSSDISTLIKNIRFIKNNIIGNPTKKRLYVKLGIGARLSSCLASFPNSSELLVEVCAVFCSLAHGDPSHISSLVDDGALEALLSIMSSSNDSRVVDSAVRGIRALVQYPLPTGKWNVFINHIQKLVDLFIAAQQSHSMDISQQSTLSSLSTSSVSFHIAEVIACILGKIAALGDEENVNIHNNNLLTIKQSGATSALCEWLHPDYACHPRVQSAVLEALSYFTAHDSGMAQFVGSKKANDVNSPLNVMFSLLRDKRPFLRLSAAACLTNIYKLDGLPNDRLSDVKLILLPTLIKMFDDISLLNTISGIGSTSNASSNDKPSRYRFVQPTVQQRSIAVFARLVSDSQELQGLAMEGDAIVRLAGILLKNTSTIAAVGEKGAVGADQAENKINSFLAVGTKEEDFNNNTPGRVVDSAADKLLESGLDALAAVSSFKEECRRQVIDLKLLPLIVSSLSHSSTKIRESACRTTRSLSRSVKNLRTSLMDAGIADPLFDLLSDDNLDVQVMATATLCNIVLDFSPMKKKVLERGCVKRLVEILGSHQQNQPVQISATYAQKVSILRLNAIWALKNILFQADSSTKAAVMTHLSWEMVDRLLADPEVAIQEQAMNLVRNLACGKVGDVDAVFKGFGGTRVLQVVEEKLTKMTRFPEIVLQALYTLVNLSIGDAHHKTMIMSHASLLSAMLANLNHESSQLRVASIWCIINLTWPDEPLSSERIAYFVNAGVPATLAQLVNDESTDVKERAKTALNNLQNTGGSQDLRAGMGTVESADGDDEMEFD